MGGGVLAEDRGVRGEGTLITLVSPGAMVSSPVVCHPAGLPGSVVPSLRSATATWPGARVIVDVAVIVLRTSCQRGPYGE